MRRVFGLRFLVEAALIVGVAVLVWHEDVSKAGIVAAIAGAWLAIAAAEWGLSVRSRERLVEERSEPEAPAPFPAPFPEPEPPSAPTSVVAPEPRHVRLIAPEPEPEPEPGGEPQLEPERTAAERVVGLPLGGAPREWNLWELERMLRESSGAEAARHEERSFLLMYLREFADPDGALPVTFDPLVREAFGELLGASS